MSVVHSSAPFWQDPGHIAFNRRNSHVPLHSITSTANAVKYLSQPPWSKCNAADAAAAPSGTGSSAAAGIAPRLDRRQELSGCEWGCKVFRNPNEVPEDFFEAAYDDSAFDKVNRQDHACVCGGGGKAIGLLAG
jgi:hypothetical protein